MVLVDMDFLVEDIFVLANEVEAFDSHGEALRGSEHLVLGNRIREDIKMLE